MSFYDGRVPIRGPSYLPRYMQELVVDSIPEKLGVAALSAVVASGANALTPAFWALCVFWAADMLTGTIRAWRDPTEPLSWERAMDGAMRLVMILVLPTVVAMGEFVFTSAWGWDVDGKAVMAVIGIMAVQELISVTENVEWFYPGIRKFRGRLVSWRDGEAPTEQRGSAVFVQDDKERGDEP